MISFGLKLGVLNEGLSDAGLLELGQYVAGHVSQGSGDTVSLVPNQPVKLQYALPNGQAASALRLHQGLAQLLGGTTNVPVTDVGVLFAHTYAPAPSIFGLMFDLGFTTPDDPSGGLFTQVPRQGCALFLGAIGAARPDSAAYLQQLAFTSVHEVGHIFNLTHQTYPLTFMAQSQQEGPYGSEAYFFGENQRKWLARCGVDADVTPGGNPFRDLGYADAGFAPREASNMELGIAMSSSAFWPFEPVMLNLKLALKGRARSARLPAELDPGYGRFRICIEGPDGKRRFYRSPLRFCTRTAVFEVVSGEPFSRDIPVFGQAGGFTFSEAGLHRLWIDFDLTRSTKLRSNVCEFEVLAPRPRSKVFRTLKTTVGTASGAKSLFYREGRWSELKALVDAVAESGAGATNAMTKYVCARAMVGSAGQLNKPARRWAERQLRDAVECGLPHHQETRAIESLEHLRNAGAP